MRQVRVLHGHIDTAGNVSGMKLKMKKRGLGLYTDRDTGVLAFSQLSLPYSVY